MKPYFCIDLDSARPEVLEYSGAALAEDMEFFRVRNALGLDTPDRRVFRTDSEAESFLGRYNGVLRDLAFYCWRPGVCRYPALRYRRRYIVQAIMGEKNETARTFRKNWSVGQKFTFHDQRYFLPCELTKPISEFQENGETLYKYAYRVLGKNGRLSQ